MSKFLVFCAQHRVAGLIVAMSSLGLLVGGPQYIQQTNAPLSGHDLAMFQTASSIMTSVGLAVALVGIVVFWVGVASVRSVQAR